MLRSPSTRSRLLAALLAVVVMATAGCSGSDDSEESSTPSIKVNEFPGTLFSLPLHVAIEKGFFEEAGVSVETVPTKDGPTAVAAIVSGDLDLASNSTEAWLPLIADQGRKFQAASNLINSRQMAIVVKNGSPIPHAGQYPDAVEDLEGMTVGVAALGGVPQRIIESLMAEAGMSKDAVEFVAVGAAAVALPALEQGQVDALAAYEPAATQAVDIKKIATMLLDLRTQGPEELRQYSSNAYVGKTSTLDAKPEAMEAFREGLQAGIDFLNSGADRDEAVSLTADYLQADPSVATLLLDRNAQFYTTEFNEEQIANVESFLHSAGLMKGSVSLDDFVWKRS